MSECSTVFALQLAEAEHQLKVSEERLNAQEKRLASLSNRASELVRDASQSDLVDVSALARKRAENTQVDLATTSATLDAIRRDVKAHAMHIELLSRAPTMTDAEWEAHASAAADAAVETARSLRSLKFYAQSPLTAEQESAMRSDVQTNYRARTMAQLREQEQNLLEEARALADRQTVALKRLLPPKVFAILTGQGLYETPSSKACTAWYASGRERAFLLRSGVGVGKSTAAGVVAKAAILRGLDVSWHRSRQFISAVLHQYDEKSPKLGSDLVIVDDVGLGEKNPDDFGEALCAFLDDYSTPILMTTNVTKEDMRLRYDVRVIDRLRDVAGAVDVGGETRRRKSELF